MKRSVIEKDLWHYHIPTNEPKRLGCNIFALLDGENVLLIDAGYPQQIQQVLEDLSHRGKTVHAVLPTHFHPDHIEGIPLCKPAVIYGNQYAKDTMKVFYTAEEMTAFQPTVLIDDHTVIQFGAFRLTFDHLPGHSDCTMAITINDHYLHLGDLYIRTDHGREVLPFVYWKNIHKHIAALDHVLSTGERIYLLSHGRCPIDRSMINEGISNRKMYLQALLDSDNTLSAEDAVSQCSQPFEFLHWRDSV